MIIKVCGLREPQNILAISELPVDWLGLIFYPKSKRYLGDGLEVAEGLMAAGLADLPQKRVGVFVNAELPTVIQAVDRFALDFVQLHGDESPEYCHELKKYWLNSSVRSAQLIKVFSVGDDFDFAVTEDYLPYCNYFLFDTKDPQRGGTGRKFDWLILQKYTGPTPFLLSGGIGPEDAAAVKSMQHPHCVGIDLNSRFEIEPGLKEVALLQKFIEQVRLA